MLVPAHDEAGVIDRCLAAVVGGDDGPGPEVVVVCNGCTDDTAVRAARHPGVRVIEIAEASKAAALRAGSAALTGFPRVVLDADVVLSRGTITRLAECLTAPGGPLVATPRAVFVTEGRPWAVRAFYRVHQRLPYLREAPVGPGCFGLSQEGWERLGSFPDLTADDLWVQRHFRRSERATIEDVAFTVQTPRRLRYLLRVRTRVYRGVLELDQVLPAVPDDGTGAARPGRVGAVLRLVRSPLDLPDVVVYSLVNVLALRRARAAHRAGHAAWERDDSTR